MQTFVQKNMIDVLLGIYHWSRGMCHFGLVFFKLFYAQFIYKNTLENLKLNLSTKYHDYWMFGLEVIAGDPNFLHFGSFWAILFYFYFHSR